MDQYEYVREMAVVCRLYLNMSEMLTGRAIDSNYTKEA
jgi:hypothetical protein